MKYLGPARQILGMQIVRDRKAKKLVLSQEKYIQKALRRFSMDKAKVVSTPLAMHFKLSTKQCPSSDDEKEDMKKVPYASAVDIAGDVDTRKSTSGGAVSWQSRLQKCVALSTTEDEFIVVVEACKELLWKKRFLGKLGYAQDSVVWNHRRWTPGKERCGWMDPTGRDAGKLAVMADVTTGERDWTKLTPTQ
uniref:Reverse transcriptase Ty1/copia-type domain-containing protein n=1 Tax=Solanum lycopersicum TaxID=4081 RepID=A0A3Q7IWY3_SOLLC